LIVGQAIGIVGRLNSECSQQNSANKNKRGAHSQYIQSQGSVHVRASLADVARG
jgi:type VI protein secretion system component Hcp